MFILRHLIDAAKHRKADRQIYAAFIDFTQAYDRVNRSMLWEHLTRMNVPPILRTAAKGLYEGDSYTLVDGDKRTDPIVPTRGVRQGCPLSPLLFALFVNDVVNCLPSLRGATAKDNSKISHIMYADDLTLLSNKEEDLQHMLHSLGDYARKKELTVNVKKSQVMVFNKPRQSIETVFNLGLENLETVPEFKYLGMYFEESGGFSKATKAAATNFMAGISKVNQIAVEHNVSDDPHALLWLFQIFGLPSSLYGAQIWSTKDLVSLLRKPETPCDLMSRYLSFIKRALGVKRSTPNLIALREAAKLPIQFYWLRMIIRFWNACIKFCDPHTLDNPLMSKILRADLKLAEDKGSCWSKDVMEAINLLLPGADPGVVMGNSHLPRNIDWKTLESAFLDLHNTRWSNLIGQADPRSPMLDGGLSRKLITYDKWFATPLDDEGKPKLPRYLRHRNLPPDIVQFVTRFRTSSHHLRIETDRWIRPINLWNERICTLCDLQIVQDEKHVLCECRDDSLLRFRDALVEKGFDCSDLVSLMNSENVSDVCWNVSVCMKRMDCVFASRRAAW